MTIVEDTRAITGGVDTHSEVHVAAARKVIGLLSLWVTATVAACLVLMGLPQPGGRGGRDLRKIAIRR